MKKNKWLNALLLSVALILVGCSSSTSNLVPLPKTGALYTAENQPIHVRVNDLLSYMSLEEKVGQMAQVDRQFLQSPDHIAMYHLGSLLSGGGSAPSTNNPESWADMIDGYQKQALSTRLKIPLIYGIDAVHGHNNVIGATIFPHNIGLGAADDEALVENIARITSLEMAATGVDWNFAPCITVPRDERWGRTYEGFGEEPELVSRLGAAAIRGYQGESLAERTTVLATAKHYVADGGTTRGRDRGDAQITEEELRKIHIYPYYAALEEETGTIMASFSSWNGEKMHGSRYLMEDVLRQEMGFEGFIISDWAALGELPGSYEDQIVKGINSGIDMVMIPDDYPRFITTTIALVKEGRISMERIDEAVGRILQSKFELGLFEDPFARRELLPTVGSQEHRAIAREAVRKSQVLLKNDGILPLSKDVKNILVTGSLADNVGAQSGGWTISWQGGNGDITPGTSIREGIKELLGEDVNIYTSLKKAEGVDLDAAILVVGERPYAEGRGDNQKLTLAFAHKKIITDVTEAGIPTVTVLISGRPLMVAEEIEASNAFVAAWLPGTEGAGVADVLFGDYAPTGKLPVTWPRDISQLPINVGDEDYDPLFPFGFGLTY